MGGAEVSGSPSWVQEADGDLHRHAAEVDRLDARIHHLSTSVHSSTVQVTELSSDREPEDDVEELNNSQQLSALFADIECQEAEIVQASTQLERHLAELDSRLGGTCLSLSSPR